MLPVDGIVKLPVLDVKYRSPLIPLVPEVPDVPDKPEVPLVPEVPAPPIFGTRSELVTP
jgi:hypothetical protein